MHSITQTLQNLGTQLSAIERRIDIENSALKQSEFDSRCEAASSSWLPAAVQAAFRREQASRESFERPPKRAKPAGKTDKSIGDESLHALEQEAGQVRGEERQCRIRLREAQARLETIAASRKRKGAILGAFDVTPTSTYVRSSRPRDATWHG